jgi:hypothetical protein
MMSRVCGFNTGKEIYSMHKVETYHLIFMISFKALSGGSKVAEKNVVSIVSRFRLTCTEQ